MKKYLLALGLVAFLMTSCCDKQENNENKECCKDKKEQCDKHHECDHHGEMPGMPGMCPEMMAQTDKIIDAIANWETLEEAQKAEIITMAKTLVEKKEAMKAEMEKNGMKPDCCKDGKHEGCKHEEGKKCEHQHENCPHHQQAAPEDK